MVQGKLEAAALHQEPGVPVSPRALHPVSHLGPTSYSQRNQLVTAHRFDAGGGGAQASANDSSIFNSQGLEE